MLNSNFSTGLVYLATKYPLLSETFIYEEILALKRLGYPVVFFVLYSTGKSVHRFADELEENIHYLPKNSSLLSIKAHWNFLFNKPLQYISLLMMIIRSTLLSPVVMFKNVYAFGKGISLAYLLKDILPTHIHAHWATMPSTVALVASSLTRTSYSFTSHAWDIYKEPAMLAEKLESAAFHATISEYNKEFLQRNHPSTAEKIFVNRCGIDVKRFKFRKKYPSKKSVEILFVGRLVEKKGTLVLIDACNRLRLNGFDFTCNIVGDGPQRTQIEAAIGKYNLQSIVNLVGELPQEKLSSYWQSANMFVLPCVVEKDGNRDGIPVVLMEAMASGIPVVSTNISGIPELIKDEVSGLLVAPHDSEQLSQAMVRIIQDSDLVQRLIVNARIKVENEYDIVINSKNKAELFEKHFAADRIAP